MLGLGSSSQLGIGIAISLDDKFSAKARHVNQQMINMRKNAHSALTGAMKDYRNQAATIAAGAAGVALGMAGLVQQGAKFEHSINQIAVVGGKQLGRTRKQLSDFARGLSKEFAVSQQEIAGAMFENTKAGITKGLEEITRYQLAASQAADESISVVSEVLLGTMNSYGISAEQEYIVNGKRVRGFAMVTNGITATANATMANIQDIGEAMQYFGNTAQAAGLEYTEALAIIGKLSQSGIKGSKAGVWSANAVQHMVNSVGQFQTPKNKKAYGALGVNSDQIAAMINQGKTMDAFKMIEAASAKLERQPRAKLLNMIFGERGGKAVMNAFGAPTPGNKNTTSIMGETRSGITSDIAMRQATQMQDTLAADIKFLKNALMDFAIAFTHAATPVLRVIIPALTKAMRVFSYIADSGVGKVIAGLAAVLVPTVAVVFGFRAAVMASILALRTLTATARVGGFSGLAQGGLGSLGMLGSGGPRALAVNAMGFGRNTSTGRFVSAATTARYVSRFGNGAGILGGAAGLLGRAGGAISKFLPFLGRIAGFAFRLLPIVGWIFTIGSIIKAIYDWVKGDSAEKKQLDPIYTAYYRNLDAQMNGYSQSDAFYAQKYGVTKAQRAQTTAINQQINVNVDGRQAMSRQINQVTEQDFNDRMDFNLTQ